MRTHLSIHLSPQSWQSTNTFLAVTFAAMLATTVLVYLYAIYH